MKILSYTDVHWCSYSSIIRTRGKQFSSRLENCIESLNWVENLADEQDVDLIICCGDFFDKPFLNSEEISALREVKWSNKEHYIVIGNHDSDVSSLSYASAHFFDAMPNFKTFSSPQVIDREVKLTLIPYITDNANIKLLDYVDTKDSYVFSHNDIKGLRYGVFESKFGFDIKDIADNCKLFVNGHLHNGDPITDNGFNLGNLTGQNFGEDAFNHAHCSVVINTDNNDIVFYENPHAYNFYKITVNDEKQLSSLKMLKNNSVVSITCSSEQLVDVKTALGSLSNIVASRVCVVNKASDVNYDSFKTEFVPKNSMKQFADLAREKLAFTQELVDELFRLENS